MDFGELYRWFENRPKWLQDCARRLIEKGPLSQQDYTDLLFICKNEAIGKTVSYSGIPEGAFALQQTTKPIRLESISNIQGINALRSNKSLEFGKEPICIIYGRNGSGKSGYVRLLKQVCGVRNPGDLLSNVFIAGDQPQTAKFAYTCEGKEKAVEWSGEPIEELHGTEIYDTTCGLVYVDEENEVAYEPWLLNLFTQLTEACTNLASRIEAETDGMISSMPDLPSEYEKTEASIWYVNVSESTTQGEIDKATSWTSLDQEELNEINKRLAETNPSEKAAEFRRQANLVMKLVHDLKHLGKCFADSECSEYIKVQEDALTKRKAANEDARNVFSRAPLSGIGSEAWRLLWEAARKYSEEHAYRTQVFPYVATDARCVLCQRELDQDSRERFVSFEEFVKGELQELALGAEEKAKRASESLPDVPPTEMITMRMEAAGISDQDTLVIATEYATEIATRKDTVLKAQSIADLSPLPEKKALIDLVQIARTLSGKARSYDRDAEGQNREKLEQRSQELHARKWLSKQRQAIIGEVGRLSVIRELQAAHNLTNTTALSRRKSILTEELITNAYIQRFHSELRRFGAERVSVDLKKTRTEVGRVYHRIYLKNASVNIGTSEILSEGEFRIVSLAAFIADTEGRGTQAPFIFDDPISSLDHVYEEVIAQRLIEMSLTRQLIVFTHRLSLVGYLTKYADKNGINAQMVCLSRLTPGQVTELPIDLKRTDKAVNGLLNERVAEAKKAFRQDEVVYDNVARSICSDIRILIERIVEKDLLNEVVRRFCQEVNTKGRISALARITETDCNFVDEYITKYSRYEHSQPEEAPIPLPQPEEIESDLVAIKNFIDVIRTRNR